jgi:hypothetical protein
MDVQAPSQLSRLIRLTALTAAGVLLLALSYAILWLIVVELPVSFRSA